MKNLKQVLALGMAFSLTMSSMAGAAFSDQDSINSANSDAVELLTTLDVIQGFEDGSFRPDETVTRAQMAKMIYTIRNGGNDNADAYKSATTTFKDISGHWAEGYIKYLQNTGIIAGKSETVFDPDAVVTTAEAMKMALVLGGYRADKADLTGATWFNNTVSLATTNKLTDDVYSAMNGECTRQDAAQILANALGMTAVQWSEFTQSFLNDSDSGLALGGEKITVGYKWMDLTTYVGKLVSSGDLAIDGVAKAGNNQFTVDVDTVNDVAAGRYFQYSDHNYGASVNILNGQVNVKFKDGIDHTDLVGQEVKVLTGDKLDQVYGIYTTGTSKVVESTMDKVEVEFKNGKLTNGKLKVDGTSYNIYENGDDANAKIVYADADSNSGKNIKTVFSDNGEMVSDKVKMIDWDNNGDYDTIFVETVNVAEITYVGTNSITIGPIGSRDKSVIDTQKTFDNDEISIYEGAAKGDYVVITRDDYNKDKWKIEKTTTVTGTVDGVVNNERKVRVDGTWYSLANTKSDNYNDKTNSAGQDGKYDIKTTTQNFSINGTLDTFSNKDKVTLYVVGDIAYYAESTKGNDVNRPVTMVYNKAEKTGGWNDTYQAKVILPDGSKHTVDIASDSKVAYKDLVLGKMYYYTVDNDGAYKFTELGTSAGQLLAGYDDYKTDTDGIYSDDMYGGSNTSGGGCTIADDAIVFAYITDGSSHDATVYTGKAVKDAKKNDGWGKTDNGAALIEEYNGFNYTRMMNIQLSSDNQINKSTNYGYLVTDGTYSYNSEMGCYIMEYSYWNGTEVVNAIEKTSANKELWAVKGTIINFNNDGEGVIKDVSEPEEASVQIDKLHYASMKGADNNYVSLVSGSAGEVTAKVTSDTVIYYVDSNASTVDKIGQSGSGYDYVVQETSTDVRPINVAYVLNSSGNVKFMVIDVDGQLDGRGSVETRSNWGGSVRSTDNSIYVTGNASMSNTDYVAENKDLHVDGTLSLSGTGLPSLGENASITAGKIDVSGMTLSDDDIAELYKWTDEVVANGMTVTTVAPASIGAGAATVSGNVKIPTGKTLTLTSALTVNGTGTITVNGDVKVTGAINVISGTLEVKGTVAATGNINLNGGKVTVSGTMSSTAGVTGNITDVTVSGTGTVVSDGKEMDVPTTKPTAKADEGGVSIYNVAKDATTIAVTVSNEKNEPVTGKLGDFTKVTSGDVVYWRADYTKALDAGNYSLTASFGNNLKAVIDLVVAATK